MPPPARPNGAGSRPGRRSVACRSSWAACAGRGRRSRSGTTSSLSSGLPGTMARPPSLSFANAPSLVSSRKPAFRALSSGPWQAKQWSDRIGRTSREIDRTRQGVAASGNQSPSPRTGGTTARTMITDAIWRRDAMPFPLAPAGFSRGPSNRCNWPSPHSGNAGRCPATCA